jgi:hypothetical protein
MARFHFHLCSIANASLRQTQAGKRLAQCVKKQLAFRRTVIRRSPGILTDLGQRVQRRDKLKSSAPKPKKLRIHHGPLPAKSEHATLKQGKHERHDKQCEK